MLEIEPPKNLQHFKRSRGLLKQKTPARRKSKTMANKGLAQDFQDAVRLHQQGRLDLAQRQYRKVLAVQPKHIDARHLLGLVRLQQGYPADAVKEIKAALEINPSFPFAWLTLGASLEQFGCSAIALL